MIGVTGAAGGYPHLHVRQPIFEWTLLRLCNFMTLVAAALIALAVGNDALVAARGATALDGAELPTLPQLARSSGPRVGGAYDALIRPR